MTDLTRILYLKSKWPTGQDLVRHWQVLQFLNSQIVFPERSRKELAIQISGSARRGWKVTKWIICYKKQWIHKWCIPAGFQGKISKVMSMLKDDDGTLLAARKYIGATGKSKYTQYQYTFN